MERQSPLASLLVDHRVNLAGVRCLFINNDVQRWQPLERKRTALSGLLPSKQKQHVERQCEYEASRKKSQSNHQGQKGSHAAEFVRPSQSIGLAVHAFEWGEGGAFEGNDTQTSAGFLHKGRSLTELKNINDFILHVCKTDLVWISAMQFGKHSQVLMKSSFLSNAHLT